MIFVDLSRITSVTMVALLSLVLSAALLSAEVIVSADPGPQQRKRETSKGPSLNDVHKILDFFYPLPIARIWEQTVLYRDFESIWDYVA